MGFSIDGAQKVNLTGVDNDTRRIDRIRLGAVAFVDNGTRGSYFFDDFDSQRILSNVTASAEAAPDNDLVYEDLRAEEVAWEVAEAAKQPPATVFLPVVSR